MTISELVKQLENIENKNTQIYIPKIYSGDILLTPLKNVFPFIAIETKKVNERFTFLEKQKTETETVSFIVLSDY